MVPRVSFLLLFGAGVIGGAARSQDMAPKAAVDLQLVGAFEARLLRSSGSGDAVMLTLAVDAQCHALGIDDEVRVYGVDDELLATARVVADTRVPDDTRRVHVRVRFADDASGRRVLALPCHREAELPADATLRDAWLQEHATRVTLTTRFDATRGDQLADFVRIEDTCTDERVPDARSLPTSCSFTLRFAEPIDARTLESVQLLVPGRADAMVPLRVLADDENGHAFRFVPPLGLPWFGAANQPADTDAPHFVLRIAGGPNGLHTTTGASLRAPLELPLRIADDAKVNAVGWHQW